MDIGEIKKLIELLEGSSISEIEITEGETSVRLSRHKNNAVDQQIHYIAQPSPLVQTPSTVSNPVSLPATEIKSVTTNNTAHSIHSPMVGTFFAAASPDTPPFVKIGQHVKAGEILCIVEAMKMFNEIESDRDGKIIDILVENGSPVEYDQVLFILE